MARPSRRHHLDNPFVEGHQSNRVALAIHEIRDRRRQHPAVLELGEIARPVGHRPADVDEKVAIEVGFLFEFLDVVPIGARVHLPIDRRQIVAVDVLPVFGELHAEALERTAMQAGQKSFDDGAGLELQRAKPGDDGRVQELARAFARRWHDYIPLLGSGTAPISRSTIASGPMPSDAA